MRRAGIVMVISLFANRDGHPSIDDLIDQIGPYLYIGMREAVAVRGYDTNLLLAGVMWTLQYEWFIYACLPVLALFTQDAWDAPALRRHAVRLAFVRSSKRHMASGHFLEPVYLAMVGASALTASLQVGGMVLRSDGLVESVLALLIAALFAFDRSSSPQAILVFASLFYVITTGCSLFGVLRTSTAHRLGHLSYGIYLMQGLALATVLRPLQGISIASPALHIVMLTAATALLTMMALVAHCYVELPGMRIADRIAHWVCGGRNWALALARPGAEQPSKE